MPESALPEPIRAALNGSTFGQRREDIFRRLQQTAQQTSLNYSGKRELATERNEVVQELCEALEETFGYGLRQTVNVSLSAVTLFQNMHEIVLGSNSLCRQRRSSTSSAKPRNIMQHIDSKAAISSTNCNKDINTNNT